MITIPFSPKEVGHCYERLKKTLPEYQQAGASIEAVIRSAAPYADRLQKVLALHSDVLEKIHSEQADPEGVDEGAYLCCLYDMLEAMIAAEAGRIAASSVAVTEKNAQLESLNASIRSLPFGSPQFKTGIRRRLERHVAEALKKVNQHT